MAISDSSSDDTPTLDADSFIWLTISSRVPITELVALEMVPNSSFLLSNFSTFTNLPSARAPSDSLTAAMGSVKLFAIISEITVATIRRIIPIIITVSAERIAGPIISELVSETAIINPVAGSFIHDV